MKFIALIHHFLLYKASFPPLLVCRGVWWTRGVEENVEDGDRDRIVILPDVSYAYGELKTFVADLHCHHPHFGQSDLMLRTVRTPCADSWSTPEDRFGFLVEFYPILI